MSKVHADKIIFFDSNCLLCLWSVRFILKHDKIGDICFAALDSVLARELLSPFHIDTSQSQSVLYFSNGHVYEKSDAVFEVIKSFSAMWKILGIFKILPKRLLNFFYDVIARNRFRIFGRAKSCLLPSAQSAHRFL